MIIDHVHVTMLTSAPGWHWQFRPIELVDYFPNDEPLVDLFTVTPTMLGGGVTLDCPCGDEVLNGDDPLVLGDIMRAAEDHVAAKHPGKRP